MKRTIAIIAPLIDTRQFNLDFTLRLRSNNRDLSLATFYELATEGFNPGRVSRGVDYGEDIPSAGFYLQGILHLHGYETILTNKYDEATLNGIAEQNPFAVCISTTMIVTTASFLALLSSVRYAMPGIPVIAGGVNLWKNYMQHLKVLQSPEFHPLQPEMLFHHSNAAMDADILVIAQHGISSFLEVLKELEKGKSASLDHIPNLCLPGLDGFKFTQMIEEKVDYNEDYTRWDLIDKMPEKVPLRTSIGCPYRCRFCDFYKLYPRIFLRSSKSLAQELKLVSNRLGQNPAIIHVSDDNVFINKKRLHEVCGVIAESGLYHWVGFMRASEYSDDEMQSIKRSRLKLGMIGVESGDQGQLDRMNKHQKIDKVKRGIEQLEANGISVLMTFVVGFPGETKETLHNTADFLNNLSLTNLSISYQVYPLLIFNLSELTEPEVRAQWKLEGYMDKWSHFSMNSDEALTACYDLFREVTNVPYTYAEEGHLFNRGMFTFDTRLKLFRLRHQLTVKLMEGASWGQIAPILKEMATKMELPFEGISDHLIDEILIPSK